MASLYRERIGDDRLRAVSFERLAADVEAGRGGRRHRHRRWLASLELGGSPTFEQIDCPSIDSGRIVQRRRDDEVVAQRRRGHSEVVIPGGRGVQECVQQLATRAVEQVSGPDVESSGVRVVCSDEHVSVYHSDRLAKPVVGGRRRVFKRPQHFPGNAVEQIEECVKQASE